MSVTIDHERLAAEELGLKTVGQVLTHVQREKRLVTHLLIDGREPDFSTLGNVRASPLAGHTLFIETAEPREMALEVIAEVDAQLHEADRLRGEAVDLLHRNQPAQAMERLRGCFSTWHNAQESVVKTAQLLRIDLETVRLDLGSMAELIGGFSEQLRHIRDALEGRDFVTLADILAYEATETSAHWQSALVAIRRIIEGRS